MIRNLLDLAARPPSAICEGVIETCARPIIEALGRHLEDRSPSRGAGDPRQRNDWVRNGMSRLREPSPPEIGRASTDDANCAEDRSELLSE